MQDNFEYVKDQFGRDARFNKTTGELEILQADGSWLSIEQDPLLRRIAEAEQNRLEKAEQYEQEKLAKKQPLPPSEQSLITGQIEVLFRDSGFVEILIDNKSSYKIEEFDMRIDIYSTELKEKLVSRELTIDSSGNRAGTPYAITSYREFIPPIGEDQELEFAIIEVRGFPYNQ
ncbi:MAG: hypothetical protein ACO37W_15735 [Prochlorotrichaceae cyanobacterium]